MNIDLEVECAAQARMRELHELIAKAADESEVGEKLREELDSYWYKLTPAAQERLREYSVLLYEEGKPKAICVAPESSIIHRGECPNLRDIMKGLLKEVPSSRVPALILPGSLLPIEKEIEQFLHPNSIAQETQDQLTHLLKQLPSSIPFLDPGTSFADRNDREARRIRAREAAKEAEQVKKIQAYGQYWVEEHDGKDKQTIKNRKAAKAAKKARKQQRKK